MTKTKTQFGVAQEADFSMNTWTFRMPDNYLVAAGEFAIIDKAAYEKMQSALSDSLQMLEQTLSYRNANKLTAGNVFLEYTIDSVREVISEEPCLSVIGS